MSLSTRPLLALLVSAAEICGWRPYGYDLWGGLPQGAQAPWPSPHLFWALWLWVCEAHGALAQGSGRRWFPLQCSGSPCPVSSPLQPPASQPITVALTVAFPGKLDLQASCLTTLLMVWQRGTEHPGPPHEGPGRTSLCHSLRFYDATLSSLHRSLEGRNWQFPPCAYFSFPYFLSFPQDQKHRPACLPWLHILLPLSSRHRAWQPYRLGELPALSSPSRALQGGTGILFF